MNVIMEALILVLVKKPAPKIAGRHMTNERGSIHESAPKISLKARREDSQRLGPVGVLSAPLVKVIRAIIHLV